MIRRLFVPMLLLLTATLGCRGTGAPAWNAPTWNSTGFNAPPWNPTAPTTAAMPNSNPWGTGLIPPPATGSYLPSPITPPSLAGAPPSFPAGNTTPFSNPTFGFTPPTIDPTTGLATNTPQISPYWNNPATVPSYAPSNGFNNIPPNTYGATTPNYPNYNNGYGYNPATANNPLTAWGDRLRGAFTQSPQNWFSNQTSNWYANNRFPPGATQGWSFPQGVNPTAPSNGPGFSPPAGYNGAPSVAWNDRNVRPTPLSNRQPSNDNYAPEPPVRIPDAALAGDVTPPPRRPPVPPPVLVSNPRQPTTPSQPPTNFPPGFGRPAAPTSSPAARPGPSDWIEITQLPRRK